MTEFSFLGELTILATNILWWCDSVTLHSSI